MWDYEKENEVRIEKEKADEKALAKSWDITVKELREVQRETSGELIFKGARPKDPDKQARRIREKLREEGMEREIGEIRDDVDPTLSLDENWRIIRDKYFGGG